MPPLHPYRPPSLPFARQGCRRGPSGLRSALATAVIALSIAAAGSAVQAQEEPAVEDPPVLLTADEVTYDESLDLIIARGNVELVQGTEMVMADVLVYNQSTEIITASGNVVYLDPEGNVNFAEYAELTDDFARGFSQEVSTLLVDNTRLIARSAERTPENVVIAERGVYSPCLLCPDDPEQAPIWQLRANRIEHDRVARDITYYDAFFDVYGFPIFYTPYFSHPDPTVTRRSGFLFPLFGTTPNLGQFANISYYWDIQPQTDATFTVVPTTDSGVLLGGELRQRFDSASVQLRGSVNQSDLEDDVGDTAVARTNQFRWYIEGIARYDIDDHWRAGANFARVSDDTFAEVFELNSEDVLESEFFVEGFYGLSYALAEVLEIQDTRPGAIRPANARPNLSFDYRSQPGAFLGGQVFGHAGIQSLSRENRESRSSELEGVDTRRFAGEAGWRDTYITDFGVLATLSTAISASFHWSDDLPADPDNFREVGVRSGITATQIFPRASVELRYPWVATVGDAQFLFEPLVRAQVAPDIAPNDDIPNNDSLDVELDDVNLLTDSRFTGIDRVEGGGRIDWGVTLGLSGGGLGENSLFVGQSHRLYGDPEFPEGTGLADDTSDFVGRLRLQPHSWLTLNYRFRFDANTLSPRRQEVSAGFGPSFLRGGATYTRIEPVPDSGRVATEELTGSASLLLGDYWRLSGTYTYDVDASASRSATFVATYADECIIISANVEQDFTERLDVADGLSVFVTVTLKDLGSFGLGVEASDLFGSESASN